MLLFKEERLTEIEKKKTPLKRSRPILSINFSLKIQLDNETRRSYCENINLVLVIKFTKHSRSYHKQFSRKSSKYF